MARNPSSNDLQRILCVEPTGELCTLLERMLHDNDLDICHLPKVEHIEQFLKEHHCAVVLLENRFTETDLRAQIGKIKAIDRHVKIVMVSAVDGETERTALNAGADVFLTKPFTKSILIDAVLSKLHDS